MAGVIRVERVAHGVAVVALTGEFDLEVKDDVQAAVERAWGLEPNLIVDISEVTFLDSTILMVVLQALRRADASERESIAVVAPLRSAANRLLVLSGFTQLLMPIVETREEALESLEG